MSANLFDESFLKKLASLKFLVKKILLAGSSGEKFLRQRGGRLEFNDYRDYTPGDEAKYIDWNVFGRSEKLFVKEFAKEESVVVYLILDLTASMKTADGFNKLDYAKQLAAALGYVALVAGHRLYTIGFSDNNIISLPEFHRENEIFGLLKSLEPLAARGRTNLKDVLESLARQITRKGLIVFVSDLMINEESPADALPGIQQRFTYFVNHGFEVNLIHLLSPGEIDIPQRGLTKLRDSETGQVKTFYVNKTVADRYQQIMDGYIENWKSFALNHNIRYFYIKSDTSLETSVLDFLRRGGLLK